MSRFQDAVIDDDEESCPLCIEEFDLSDKNFKPCPCGYQICQFCYNSMINTYDKSNCPNCRRKYDKTTIEYKIPTAEELKADQLNRNKKLAAAKRKEVEKREVEASSRRNLAGVRVKQQNLVYVIGLEPSKKDETSLMETLRGKDYFGQYGPIEKIVVSKPKPGALNQGVGVYVTFKNKDDAATCINCVDGSANGDRILRAQYGTTKYCSTYLRGDVCLNKNCSFLHENGEEGQTTNLQNESIDSKSKAVPVISQSTSQPLGSSSAMARENSRDGATSRQDSIDGSALPSSVGWVNNGPVVRARRSSQTASISTASPQLAHAAVVHKKPESLKPVESAPVSQTSPATTTPPKSSQSASPVPVKQSRPVVLDSLDGIVQRLRAVIGGNSCAFHFDPSCLPDEAQAIVATLPPLIDPYGGAKRRVMQNRQADARAKIEAEEKRRLEEQAKSAAEDAMDEDSMATGSLALGGEPEEDPRNASARGAIGRPPQQTPNSANPIDQLSNLNLNSRSLTPQQRQQLAVLNAANVHNSRGIQPPSQNTAFELSDFDRRGPQYSQAQYDQISGHARHGSRYFNNDTKTTNSRFSSQQQQQPSFFSSGVQGPPPGLPTAGTPPISGGGMFAHGQGFTSSGFGASKDSDNLRARSGTNAAHDVKRELLLSSLQNTSNPLRSPPSQASVPGVLNGMYGQFPGAYQDPSLVKQRKKGKKQRHANTSSSGGGVEHIAADPSIVHARIHTGAGGQGLFGSNQGEQGYPLLPRSAEPLSAIHSRVSSLQGAVGTRTGTPKIPPGFQHQALASSHRTLTPSIPPGFENLHAHPSRADVDDDKTIMKKEASGVAILPIVPALPVLPRSRKLSIKGDPIPIEATPTTTIPPAKEPDNKDTDAALERAIASTEFVEEQEEPEGDEKATAEPASASQIIEKMSPAKNQANTPPQPDAAALISQETMTNDASQTPHEELKRADPPAMSESVEIEAQAPALRKAMTAKEPDSEGIVGTSVMMSGPETPPAKGKTEKKRPTLTTLNITREMIAKSESQSQAPPSTTTERSAVFPNLAQIRQSSRQPSVSVSTNVSRPSTPGISDNLVSHDVSWAGSPVPSSSAVRGSAPTRQKTKTQKKKERQDKARKATETSETGSVAAAPSAPTPPSQGEVGPIATRQKKQKKQKSTNTINDSRTLTKELNADISSEKDAQSTAISQSADYKASGKVVADLDIEPDRIIEATPVIDEPPSPETPIEVEDIDSYTLRDFYTEARRIEGDYQIEDSAEEAYHKHQEIQELLASRVSPPQNLLAELIATGEIAKDHPLFALPSFASAAFKLPSDNRKGQAYLDGNGYSSSDVFGMVYLPNKEKRALYNGHAVSVADSGDRRDDLLRRCLITPNGSVLRHLSREEGEKVLDLEERRSWYLEEFGDLGRMDGLGRLEDEDFINLEGGFDELSQFGERHGVCWVIGDNERAGRNRQTQRASGKGLEDDYGIGERPVGADEYDDAEHDRVDEDEEDDEEELDGEEMVLGARGEIDDADYDTQPFPFDRNLPPLPDMVNMMPGAWDPGYTSSYPNRLTPHQHKMYTSPLPQNPDIDLPPLPQVPTRNANTLPPLRHPHTSGLKDTTINLRAMTMEQLEKRVKEKQREIEGTRREAEKSEKALNKRMRDLGRWRESVFKAGEGITQGG